MGVVSAHCSSRTTNCQAEQSGVRRLLMRRWKRLNPGAEVVVFLGVLMLLLSSGQRAPAFDFHTDSAHGNAVYGVHRSDTIYDVGDCAHCHETFDVGICGENDVMLFAPMNPAGQSDNFCFQCHKGDGSVQEDSFDRTNYNYSYWFGGDTDHHATPDNIYDAFNPAPGSSHNLKDVLDFVKTKWPETFGDESNPCNACHNPHLSQRGYPIVRPTDRNNIWGNESGEMMSDYAFDHGGLYHAPYRYGSTANYEPDGSATTDGSNLPDYVTFCSDCHDATNDIYSTSLDRDLKKVGWSQTSRSCEGYPAGDYHGSITRCFGIDGNTASGCGCSEPDCSNWGYLKEPYYTAVYDNYILCCTDCHEPHGAVNGDNSTIPYLLRKTVNGHYNKSAPGPGPWTWDREFCQSCHVHNLHCGGYGSCLDCHYHSAYVRCYACTWCVEPGAPVCVHGHSF
jgi:hypothetical protein